MQGFNIEKRRLENDTLVVITRKLNNTIKYDPRTRSNSKSNVTLATCNTTLDIL